MVSYGSCVPLLEMIIMHFKGKQKWYMEPQVIICIQDMQLQGS